jgi:hypothetical protein
MAATCYGHAVFFVMAQKHAGELRAAAVPVVVTHGRGLAEIADDRAAAVAKLARVTERRCGDHCATVRIERTTLTARLEALDVEAAEAKRAETAQDSAAAARAAAMADPVTGALAAFGVSVAHADLVAGLAFAAVLEGVACFAWLLALRPEAAPVSAVAPVAPVSHCVPVVPVAPVSSAVAASGVDVIEADTETDPIAAYATNVLAAVRAGALRPTLNNIRVFIGKSQTTARAVRERVLAQLDG